MCKRAPSASEHTAGSRAHTLARFPAVALCSIADKNHVATVATRPFGFSGAANNGQVPGPNATMDAIACYRKNTDVVDGEQTSSRARATIRTLSLLLFLFSTPHPPFQSLSPPLQGLCASLSPPLPGPPGRVLRLGRCASRV